MLFVYLEAAVRLRDVKHMPGHLDLCRPFAAHCIGYPVVTLGFGFKSYIGFRMRQRKQRDVAKENEFYLQLMQQALPIDATSSGAQLNESSTAIVPAQNVQNSKISRQSHERNGHVPNGTVLNGIQQQKSHRKSLDKCKEHDDHKHEKHDKHIEKHIDKQKINHSHSNGAAIGVVLEESTIESESRSTRRREKKEQDKEKEAAEYLQRIEMESKRLRIELQTSRTSEQELRLQVITPFILY